jgi:hypothetical protein
MSRANPLLIGALVCAALAAASPTQAASLTPVSSALLDKTVSLDGTRLQALKVGERMGITFPEVGRQTVVIESTGQGADGRRYWHGRVNAKAQDRFYIRQTKNGFVGGVRMGGRQVAFAQTGQGPLTRQTVAQSMATVAGQAYVVGQPLGRGANELTGNFAAMAQLPEGSEIALPLPNGQTEVAIVTQSGMDEQGFYQISAISRMDGVAYPTVITVGTDAVFATVLTSKGEYQVVTTQGTTTIIDPTAAGWSVLHGNDQLHSGDAAASDASTSGGTASDASTASATASTTTSSSTPSTNFVPLTAGTVDTTLTLLMTYSTSYVTQWGTEAVARARLSNIVAVANSAYANSGTGIKFKIVGWSLVRQPDTTPQVALPALRADSGYFAGVAAQRRSAGAAMTVFFAPFNAATGSTLTCGLAYVPAAGSAGLSSYSAQASSLMFAALNDGQWGNYYCESLSLAHELGHNLGNVHDKANSSFTGVFSYSYGKGVSGVFGTVMSYISPRVALFSSPQLTCSTSGAACGTATENVVATMLQTKATVAALGNATKASVSSDGYTIVSGWVVNASGAAYTGAATVRASNTAVSCTKGSTGLYVCKVPSGLSSVTVTTTATGKTVSPSTSTFSVNSASNTPVYGTRFYVR